MLGCYRKGEVADPDVYVPAIASVLARHHPSVVVAVTDPVRGLPSKLDWLPTVAEIKRACDDEASKGPRPPTAPELPPPERTPEEIERVMARYREIRAEVVGAALVEQKGERVKGRVELPDAPKVSLGEKLEALKGQPWPALSPELRKTLGLPEAKLEAAE